MNSESLTHSLFLSIILFVRNTNSHVQFGISKLG